MKTTLIVTAAALSLAACAKSPDAIAPVSMGNAYAGASCAQAAADLAAAQANLAALSARSLARLPGTRSAFF